MKVAIYARVSSTNDRQSIDRQVIDLLNYAELNNIEVVKVYEEHISGAKRNEERPILCECLDQCIGNDVDMFLMSELSRLGRKVGSVKSKEKKQEEYKQVLKELKKGTSIGEPPNCVMFQLAPFRE